MTIKDNIIVCNILANASYRIILYYSFFRARMYDENEYLHTYVWTYIWVFVVSILSILAID